MFDADEIEKLNEKLMNWREHWKKLREEKKKKQKEWLSMIKVIPYISQ